MDKDVYIILDYFPEVDGAPLIGVVKVQKDNIDNINLPEYINIYRDVTDEP